MARALRITPVGIWDSIHPMDDCIGTFCPFHTTSDHHMVEWDIHVRLDKGALVERICEHGTGHPDPDSLAYFIRANVNNEWMGVHGCDGCCTDRRLLA